MVPGDGERGPGPGAGAWAGACARACAGADARLPRVHARTMRWRRVWAQRAVPVPGRCGQGRLHGKPKGLAFVRGVYWRVLRQCGLLMLKMKVLIKLINLKFYYLLGDGKFGKHKSVGA